ncbi:MAG TPA: nucleotidyltransferase family protein [Patescibacteria group bacterium]|nr:nucleotidyltransferase family protein [Patescibacteria group bacterium]
MQAVILAAGRGTRMKGLTRNIPKPMLKIGGKPILEHKINSLPKKINEIILIVGYRGEQIMSYFKRHFNGRRIIYVYQHNFNGTGGALHLAKSVLRNRFLVIMGDDLYHKKDLEELTRHDMAIMGYEVADPSLFGVIKTTSKGNMIEVIENPKGNKYKLANTGAYTLSRKFFEYDLIPKKPGDSEFGLPQTMARMAANHEIKVIKARAWQPIGNPEQLEKAQETLISFLR